MLGDRRRTGMPAELVVRVLLIAAAVAGLQFAGVWLGGSLAIRSPSVEVAGQLLALVLVLGLVARLAYRFFDVEVAGLACLAAAMALPLLGVLRPLGTNPIAWQTIALLIAINGLTARNARAGAFTVGAAVALWLAIAPSGALLAMGLFAVCAAKWLRNRTERNWLVHALQALAFSAVALFGAGWLNGFQSCSGLGLGQVAAIVWTAAVVTLLARLEPHPRPFTLAGFGVALAGAAILLAHFSPACPSGSALGIANAQPLWGGEPVLVIQALGLPLVALTSAIHLFGRSGDWLRRWWFDYVALLFLAILLAVLDSRVAPAACALAAVPLGWQLREWGRSVRSAHRRTQRTMALAGFAMAVIPALPLTLAASAVPAVASSSLSR